MSIADAVVACAETFRRLCADLSASNIHDDEKRARYSGFIHEVSACHERFELWSSNLGAHRRDKNALDKRLREASTLQSRVVHYLKDLEGALADIIEIVSGKTTPWDELSESSSEESDLDDETGIDTEMDQLVKYVDNTVSCLLRISTIIQKPAPHDRFIKSGKFDQSFRQKWDEQHVSDKFPKIPEWLAARLGKANSRRRQFLEYRRSQHEKIASLQTIEGDNKTVVSSLPSAIKHDKNLQNTAGSEAAYAMGDLDDRGSLTSYAETVANEDALLVPTMPENAKGGSLFECPYCFLIVDGIHNRMQWKRHIYTDLQPYICLHEDCMTADETFARRHNWIQHTGSHWTHWRCNMGCSTDFSSKALVRNHFVEIHGLHGSSDHHLDALSVHVSTETPKRLSCPLCFDGFSTLKRYYKHIGRHLEQLALFIIPKDSLEEVDESLEDKEEQESLKAESERNDSEEELDEDNRAGYHSGISRSPMVLDGGNEEERQSREQTSEIESNGSPRDSLSNLDPWNEMFPWKSKSALGHKTEDAGDDNPWGKPRKEQDSTGFNSDFDASKTPYEAAAPDKEKAKKDDGWGDWGLSATGRKEKTKKEKKDASMDDSVPGPEPEKTLDLGVKEEDDPWSVSFSSVINKKKKKKKKKGTLAGDSIPEPEVREEDDPWSLSDTAKGKKKKKKLDPQQRETEQEWTPPSPPPRPVAPPPPLPPPPDISKEGNMLSKLEELLLGKAEEEGQKASKDNDSLTKLEKLLLDKAEEGKRAEIERKKAEDEKFDRLEALLISQQEAKIAKQKAKAQAAEDANQAAAEAKKRSDEDKLAKLEKLILAQKDEQLKREAAIEAQRAAADKEAGAQDPASRVAAEKTAAAAKAKELLHAARAAREEAERKAARETEEAKMAHKKAVAEAEAARDELMEAKKAADDESARLRLSNMSKEEPLQDSATSRDGG